MSSTTTSNVMPMMHVGLDNFDLVKYLVSQVMLSEEDRFEALKEYYPQAKKEDWRLWQAGQRVQIIKRDAEKGGVLRLGTEVVSDQQGTIAALLGGIARGVNRRADYVESAGKSIWRSCFQPAMAGYVESDRSVLWTQAER
ncbi:malate:quinone oxidoreductase [Escherichia coli]|uniref:malate dehydrogenase (quinone) n=1 Tax=Escherichia coli TaxID=562 RepID=A0A377BSD9_ECOLX|nr:malate:quinone oxidoreductase [Escherichia coli]